MVWLFPEGASVKWAQVTGLVYCHDALDAGVSVAQFHLDAVRPDFGPLLQSIREQFTTPLTLRVYGTERATVLVHDHKGILRVVGEFGPAGSPLQRVWGRDPTREMEVRLTDHKLPPVTESPGVDQWFTNDRDGA